MLKRTAQIARTAAEAIGLSEPSLPDAEQAAEQRRQGLTEAQHAVTVAEAALDQAYDSGAESEALSKAEAALADAKLTADRAQRSYAAAEKRLANARDYAQANSRASMRAQLQTAIEARAAEAAAIDKAAQMIADAMRKIQSHNDTIRLAMAANVLGSDAINTVRDLRRLVDLSLQRAGAIKGAWLGDGCPTCSEVITRDNELLAAA